MSEHVTLSLSDPAARDEIRQRMLALMAATPPKPVVRDSR
jgi:hypothetical protein